VLGTRTAFEWIVDQYHSESDPHLPFNGEVGSFGGFGNIGLIAKKRIIFEDPAQNPQDVALLGIANSHVVRWKSNSRVA